MLRRPWFSSQSGQAGRQVGGIRNHYVPPGKRAFHFLKTRMRGVAEHVQLRDWSSVLGFRLQHKLASEPATV